MPAKKHTRKPRRAPSGKFAGKRKKGETIRETVMPTEYCDRSSAPGAEAPREAAAQDYGAQKAGGHDVPTFEYCYSLTALEPPRWYRRVWDWLVARS